MHRDSTVWDHWTNDVSNRRRKRRWEETDFANGVDLDQTTLGTLTVVCALQKWWRDLNDSHIWESRRERNTQPRVEPERDRNIFLNERSSRQNTDRTWDSDEENSIAEDDSEEEDDDQRQDVATLKKDARIEEDEDRLFLMSLMTPLKSFNMRKKISVKIRLMEVLDDAFNENN